MKRGYTLMKRAAWPCDVQDEQGFGVVGLEGGLAACVLR